MFAKILGFLSCLFLGCVADISTAARIIETKNEPPVVYEAPKTYATPSITSEDCRKKYYVASLMGTGIEAKKSYENYGNCILRVHNESAMPKDIACQQKDGFHNTPLQFTWSFGNQEYFDEAGNWGFSKIAGKLYFDITEHHLATDGPYSKQLFEYNCNSLKSLEIKIPILVPYRDVLVENSKNSKFLLMKIGGNEFRGERTPFSLGIYDIKNGSVQQGFLFSYQNVNYVGTGVKSSFIGSEKIQTIITQYINDYGVGKYMKKHSITDITHPQFDVRDFGEFDVTNINKYGRGDLIVTMPGFKVIFKIDIFKKKIR